MDLSSLTKADSWNTVSVIFLGCRKPCMLSLFAVSSWTGRQWTTSKKETLHLLTIPIFLRLKEGGLEIKSQSRLCNKTRQACALIKNREKHAWCNVGQIIQFKVLYKEE